MDIKKEKPRGLIRDVTSGGLHLRFEPTGIVRGFVEHYWYVSWNQPEDEPVKQKILPHPNIHLTVEVRQEIEPDSRITGVVTGVFEKELSGKAWVFGVKFLPGGFYPFIQKDLSGFSDQILPLTEALGENSHDYVENIAKTGEPVAKAKYADEFLQEYCENFEPDPDRELVRDIVGTIQTNVELTSVDIVCERFAINKRRLQRLCAKYAGAGPKWIVNRYRLHEALAGIEAGRQKLDWASLALELGYADQSHFIRDFKNYTGYTPAGYEARLQNP